MDKKRFDELKLIASVARLYYREGRKQHEIQRELNLTSQGAVSKYLKAAEAAGIVRHEIDPYFTVDLVKELRERFPHLQEIALAWFGDRDDSLLLRELGNEAAAWFLRAASPGARIGLSCGNTLSAFIDALDARPESKPQGCRVYALITLAISEITAVTPAGLVANFVRKLPASTGRAFQFPDTTRGSRTQKIDMRYYGDHPDVRSTLEESKKLGIYLIGLGQINDEAAKGHSRITGEFNDVVNRLGLGGSLKALHAIGESVHQPFDASGTNLIGRAEFEPLRRNMLFTDLNDIRRHVAKNTARVVAIAGGRTKRDAILTAIRSKLCNVLITDSESAAYVLQKTAPA